MSFANSERVVLISALLGGRDHLCEQPSRKNLDWVCFCDESVQVSPYRRVAFVDFLADPRRSTRDIKIRPHRYLPDADISIWHDANIQFLSLDLVDELCFALELNPIVFTRHSERDCAYREAEWCLREGKDSKVQIDRTVQRLRAEGHPERAGLLNGGLIARRNRDPQVIRFNEIWWDLYSNGSERDQISLVHALNSAEITPGILNSDRLAPPFVKVNPHRTT